MENYMLLYLAKVSFTTSICFLLYKICFARDTFFIARRVYLICTLVLSFIIPSIEIDFTAHLENNIGLKVISEPLILIANNSNQLVKSPTFNWFEIALFISILVSLCLFIIFVSHIFRIMLLIRKSKKYKYRGCKIIECDNSNLSSYSFFLYIFINQTQDTKTKEKIFEHEYIHARQYHSADIILMELYFILFWWNPFTWLIRNEMKINHEYLADRGVLKRGFEKKNYQYALLSTTSQKASLSIINFFNVSPIKKRIAMMNKKRTSAAMSVKYLLILPILGLLIFSNNLNARINKLTNPVHGAQSISNLTEDEKNEIFRFIRENLKYPTSARETKSTGFVTVTFTVDENGKIKDPEISRGVDESIDNEVLRVIKSIPQLKRESNSKEFKQEIKMLFDLQESDITNKHKNTDVDFVIVGY